MGVLYEVLFKPIGSAGSGSPATAAIDPPSAELAPEWVLDARDGGAMVWRRYGPPTVRRRVKFLDAVEVHVFERDDDYATERAAGDDASDDADDEDDLSWTNDWWTEDDLRLQDRGGLRCDHDDYPVLIAMSVTALGLCLGLAYVFTPVKWLLHHIID